MLYSGTVRSSFERSITIHLDRQGRGKSDAVRSADGEGERFDTLGYVDNSGLRSGVCDPAPIFSVSEETRINASG